MFCFHSHRTCSTCWNDICHISYIVDITAFSQGRHQLLGSLKLWTMHCQGEQREINRSKKEPSAYKRIFPHDGETSSILGITCLHQASLRTCFIFLLKERGGFGAAGQQMHLYVFNLGGSRVLPSCHTEIQWLICSWTATGKRCTTTTFVTVSLLVGREAEFDEELSM